MEKQIYSPLSCYCYISDSSVSVLNPSTPLGFLKDNDYYFSKVLTYSFNEELVLYSASPFLESWFIFLLLHNRITSLWQVQQLLTWKSNIRKVCIFSCLLMWCSSWKQGGEAVWGDLTALPTTAWEPLLWPWDQNVGKPFLQAWVCPLCLALQWSGCCGFVLCSQKCHWGVLPWTLFGNCC